MAQLLSGGNDKFPSIYDMIRTLAMVIFPGFQLLDAAGPLSAFEIAESYAPGAYRQTVLAVTPGLVASSAGVKMLAEPLGSETFDTLLIAGGEGARAAALDPHLIPWVQGQSEAARRTASICSGAYILAQAGLLDGRRATTHWQRSPDFARRYPKVKLEPDRIYVRDGKFWTSAGITAGIDLALALIAEDLGDEIARRVAQQLVVYHRRPGGQSQFSALIEMGGPEGRFASLVDWMRLHIAEPLTVDRLADQAAMSPRNFARAFAAGTGMTPAKAVERLRLEIARERVEAGSDPIDRVALLTGFGDPERMRRAFVRAFGQPPQALRRLAKV